MQQKYVYLFELDSARTGEREIEIGQKCLFDEIIGNGNCVILTYNQLVDSRTFLSLVLSDEYFPYVLELFEQGALKVSRFGHYRTPVQYFLNSIHQNLKSDNNAFLCSALPIKKDQKLLFKLLERSLMNSDLSELQEYIQDKTPEERRHLLREYIKGDGVVSKSDYNDEQALQELKMIKRFVEFLLKISFHPEYQNAPKAGTGICMGDYVKLVSSITKNKDNENLFYMISDGVWEDCVNLLKLIPLKEDRQNDWNNRSNWHVKLRDLSLELTPSNELDEHSESTRRLKEEYQLKSENILTVLQITEAIIDLCYNYTNEQSIYNVSLHYPIEEIYEGKDAPHFMEDFLRRLNLYLEIDPAYDQRFLQKDLDYFENYQKLNHRQWQRAVRLAQKGYRQNKTKQNHQAQDTGISKVPYYERKEKEQRARVKLHLLKHIVMNMLQLGLFVLIGIAVEIGLSALEDFLRGLWIFAEINLEGIMNIAFVILFIAISEVVGIILERVIPGFSGLSESVARLVKNTSDLFYVTFVHKACAYKNQGNYAQERDEDAVNENTIPRTQAYMDYRKLVQERKNTSFGECEYYPIITPKDNMEEENKQLRLIQEYEAEHGIQMGVVYKSPYNMVVVDLIKEEAAQGVGEEELSCYPYERILPSVEKGAVVMVPYHQDTYYLIKQWRHALRGTQIGFPRGFAEEGLSPQENAAKELREELGATIASIRLNDGSEKANVQLLGVMTPDSGLTGNVVSVYLCEIETPVLQNHHEGIEELIAVTKEELTHMIKQGEITDGFTLAAVCMMENNKTV